MAYVVLVVIAVIILVSYAIFEYRQNKYRYSRWEDKQTKGWTMREFTEWDKMPDGQAKIELEKLLDEKHKGGKNQDD